ncbi:amino acid dehydrogenase [Pseudoxanthomonas broegbernensis]|uniref:Amino acid dehydrogenase n=1 Tax=Pseudoxanthomonas broegbernensis TaxID=83619 RepID=A0A7V8GKA0_9GAMM|nr:FAD-dependent oxidoreductase [Pseudoxanthomonas broegbernensis]KAF1684935.1 amino acid dehydrogenase [Pseudoxanthomonas broegbernensis]MBB6066306.1 D-amino-acid dehydrogenase [Pseudoxanthomonas broegbernensis]
MSDSPPTARQGAEVAVIGAGVVGLATAYALARRGARVLLLDRAPGPARGASFANGAQLSYAYTDAMAGPSLWRQLPALLCGRDAAFRARASADPDFWRWGLAFLRNATASRLRRNTLATLELALESRAAMAALLARHPIGFEHRVAGKMHVYYDAAALPAAAAMIRLKQAHGVNQRLIGAEEAAALEPALAGLEAVAGVVHSPEEETGDAWRFSIGLLQVLRDDYEVQARFGFALRSLRRDGSGWRLETGDGQAVSAGRVVVCAGIDSAALLRPLGLRVPLMAVKGYSFTAPCGPAAPAVSITDTSRKLVFCRLDDRIRVAGLADLNHWDPAPAPARLAELVAMARASLPRAADYTRIESHWAGLRPVTPFSSPVVRHAGEGLVLNIGHGMLGWTLAMGSGERAAAALLDPP